MAKKRRSKKDVKAPVEKFELTISSKYYDFLEAKVESEGSSEDVEAAVDKLATDLLIKGILEYKLLAPEKTIKELSSELSNLYLWEYTLEKSESRTSEEGFKMVEHIIHYVLNNDTLTDIGQFEELKRGLKGFFTDKELILDVISYIKKMNKECYIKDSGSLILFEDYVKRLPSE